MKTTKEAIQYLLDANPNDRQVNSISNFIDGEFVVPSAMMESEDPSTGGVWLKIPRSGQSEVDAAVEAAHKAFPRYTNLDLDYTLVGRILRRRTGRICY